MQQGQSWIVTNFTQYVKAGLTYFFIKTQNLLHATQRRVPSQEKSYRLCKRQVGKLYASGLVFLRDTTRSPSFHCPRFFIKSIRSKRLRTLRLPNALEIPFLKLECCDIFFNNKAHRKTKCGHHCKIKMRRRQFFVFLGAMGFFSA